MFSTRLSFRQTSYGQQMIELISDHFRRVPEHRAPQARIPLADVLMSAYAVFSLKFPSLLQFEEERRKRKACPKNLEALYQVSRVPSDTQMREIVDEIQPDNVKELFPKLFEWIRRKKLLQPYEFWKHRTEDYYLASVDGTGYFSSEEVHCSNCLTRKSETPKGERVLYQHHMLSIALVHPHLRTVVPLTPETIIRQDGREKNDCELNAIKRLIQNFREEHPFLNVIFNLDSLYGNNVIVRLLQNSRIPFIISVKPGDHVALFKYIEGAQIRGNVREYQWQETFGDKIKKTKTCRYRYKSDSPLNGQEDTTWVNFIEYWEEIDWADSKGHPQKETYHGSWVTDLDLRAGKKRAKRFVEGARARWSIENETFNTLKNQGYNFEHNYGHGEQYLAENFSFLMMLAFFVDQIQQMGCRLFQKILSEIKRKIRVWEEIRSIYKTFKLTSWTHLLEIQLQLITGEGISLDTS